MNERKKVTVPDLGRWRESGRRISMITAYDAMFARIVDEAEVDVILVGDSLGMVVQGHANTIPVDLSEMEYHTRNVARAGTKALVVGDLPFGSYQASAQQAVESSIVLTKAGAECVKLEGGVHMADTIAAITRVDIPVMGHIGLTPQSLHRMGGHKVQGRVDGYEAGSRNRLLEDAYAVEQAGACAMVILVPSVDCPRCGRRIGGHGDFGCRCATPSACPGGRPTSASSSAAPEGAPSGCMLSRSGPSPRGQAGAR